MFENALSEDLNSARLSIANKNNTTSKLPLRRHLRGSLARHTLGVDVTWFKKLLYKTPSSTQVDSYNTKKCENLDSIQVTGLNITT